MLNPMARKPAQSRKKVKTLDDFATAIHGDYVRLHRDVAAGFRDLRAEMATKDDLRQLRSETGTGFRNVHADLKMITDVMVSKADLTQAIKDEIGKSEYAKQTDDLCERVRQLEQDLLPLKKLALGKKMKMNGGS